MIIPIHDNIPCFLTLAISVFPVVPAKPSTQQCRAFGPPSSVDGNFFEAKQTSEPAQLTVNLGCLRRRPTRWGWIAERRQPPSTESMDHTPPTVLGLAASPATACRLGGEQTPVARSTRHCTLACSYTFQLEPMQSSLLYNTLPA
ncbi:uncharacterized protein AKAW2_80407A [Aspergillus luchuensis]|uniref:Secreted protein n=1 Tax=Aspergillus kawachii TaxID=1069201 RepID=A0A7R7WKC8_ASPKA|nr:uncharacterized protein AKAW2_80407A [Aspergillus luchuensis]BCS04606.1 hypothetical protein AKAW2_80407A [Aspergillus luchuensis]